MLNSQMSQKRAVPRNIAETITSLCRYIESHPHEVLTLDALSRRAHVSPWHLQRRFKAQVGVTPRQYSEACRLRALQQKLRSENDDASSVTQAVYDAGFGSTNPLYEGVGTRLGMTPRQYRAGGEGVTISYASTPTSFGHLLLGATDRGLCFVQFADDEGAALTMLRHEYPQASLQSMHKGMRPLFDEWMQALVTHLHTGQPAPELPLDVSGTAFQIKVWRYLQKIPSGDVQSYSEVATGIGQPSAVRAVARACASNNLALLVPCHRVIRADGGLGGYRWGIERKRALIDRERALRADSNGSSS